MKEKRKTCPYKNCPLSEGMKICAYEECHLPRSNNKYWIQFVYLFVSILILLRNSREFTFYSLFMFTAPILLDLVYSQFDGNLYRTIHIFYIVVNVAIAVLCLSGMFGFFVDNGDSFAVVVNAIIFPGAAIQKKWLVWPMVVDLLIPVIMVFAAPTQQTKDMSEFERESRKEG